jgi:hypothetical protein
MSMRAAAVTACAGLAGIAGLVGFAPAASATPVTTGCPSAYEAKTVDEWVALGYPFAPARVDDEGNRDGVACGLALPDGYRWGRFVKALGFEPLVDVIYLFGDNDSPAQRG